MLCLNHSYVEHVMLACLRCLNELCQTKNQQGLETKFHIVTNKLPIKNCSAIEKFSHDLYFRFLSRKTKKKRKLISHWTKRVIDSSVYSARRILRNRSFFNAWNRDSQLDIGPDVHGHNISRKRRACPPFTATDNTRFN